MGMRSRIGTGPRVVVTILGVIVVGLVLLGLLALVTDGIGPFIGAIAMAILVAVPMAIVYLVARIVHKPAPQAIAPPQPPATGFPQYQVQDERLLNPDDLR